MNVKKREKERDGNSQFNCWLSSEDKQTIANESLSLGISQSAFVRLCVRIGREATEAKRTGEDIIRRNRKTGHERELIFLTLARFS